MDSRSVGLIFKWIFLILRICNCLQKCKSIIQWTLKRCSFPYIPSLRSNSVCQKANKVTFPFMFLSTYLCEGTGHEFRCLWMHVTLFKMRFFYIFFFPRLKTVASLQTVDYILFHNVTDFKWIVCGVRLDIVQDSRAELDSKPM